MMAYIYFHIAKSVILAVIETIILTKRIKLSSFLSLLDPCGSLDPCGRVFSVIFNSQCNVEHTDDGMCMIISPITCFPVDHVASEI